MLRTPHGFLISILRMYSYLSYVTSVIIKQCTYLSFKRNYLQKFIRKGGKSNSNEGEVPLSFNKK